MNADDADTPAGGEAVDHLWSAAHEFLTVMRKLVDAADEFVGRTAARPTRRNRNADRTCSGSISTSTTTRSNAFDMSQTIGLDIGGTKVLGVLLAADGTIVREERQASPHTGADALVATGASIVAALRTENEPVGVGVAGLVDTKGWVQYSPNLPNVRDAPLRDLLARATGHPVIVDNDASVATIGEVTYGAARQRSTRCSSRSVPESVEVCGSAAACTAARTTSAASSATSRSTLTVRCVRAANAGTGKRSRRELRWAGWRAS